MIRECVCAVIVSWAVLSGAQAGDQHAPAALQSIQAEFTQEKHLKLLVRPLVSTGLFVFQAPGSLRWEYLTPLHSVLLMHGGQIKKMIERDDHFEEDNGAGVDAMQVVLADIGNWLDGRFEENPMFSASRIDGRTVVLTPKEAGLQAIISRIELYLGSQDGVMERVLIVEGPDAHTQLTFTNVVLNRQIPQTTFLSP